MELVKCSDYVLKCNFDPLEEAADGIFLRIRSYANFLKQKLADRYTINGFDAHPLNRFIPTDKEGNVLSEPEYYNCWLTDSCSVMISNEEVGRCFDFKQAKERVIFEGFEIIERGHYKALVYNNTEIARYGIHSQFWEFNKYKTIEDLTSLGLTLTKEGIKQLN